ncbi:MAG: (d)CMP kinase [Leptospirillia bacterium]
MPEKKPVVAVDGPSGAGKSSVCKAVARRLGLLYLDTGALYRAIGLTATDRGVDPNDAVAMERLCDGISVELASGDGVASRVLVDGEDVTDRIRTPEVSLAAAAVSKLQCVRDKLFSIQREAGDRGGVILDGRDIGTVVFPDADVKVFLDASAAERARRRYEELISRGEAVSFEETLKDVEARDEQDRTRPISPLKKADDATLIDTTELDFETVVERICGLL